IAQRDGAEARKLDKMEAVLDRTVAATRRIAADLRPLMLDDLGLIPAVEWLAEEFTQRNGIPRTLAIDNPELQVTGPHARAVAPLGEEALPSVAGQRKAKQAVVGTPQPAWEVRIRIHDDGVGFAPDAPRAPPPRGLRGMRGRASPLGGPTAVASARGR